MHISRRDSALFLLDIFKERFIILQLYTRFAKNLRFQISLSSDFGDLLYDWTITKIQIEKGQDKKIVNLER